jgi:hypothetical protein
MNNEQEIEVVDDSIPNFENMTDEEWYGVSTEEVLEIKEWLETRRLEGQKIDPETAEVIFLCTPVLDPYELSAIVRERYGCVGRSWFARARGSEIWVWFGDLPQQTKERLANRRYGAFALPRK